jgi:hypothetical protein
MALAGRARPVGRCDRLYPVFSFIERRVYLDRRAHPVPGPRGRATLCKYALTTGTPLDSLAPFRRDNSRGGRKHVQGSAARPFLGAFWVLAGLLAAALLFGLRHLPDDFFYAQLWAADSRMWVAREVQLYGGAVLFGLARHFGRSTYASAIMHVLVFGLTLFS